MKFAKQINIQNKKAYFNFEIIEKFEAGIMLYGSEIKSIREAKANIAESFCQVKDKEVFVINMNIDEYKFGTYYNHKPRRERKLLLNKREIKKIHKSVAQNGLSLIPLKLYINNKGLAKLMIAIAKGKKLHDKRETLKSRDIDKKINQLNRKK